MKTSNSHIKPLILVVVILVIINSVSTSFFNRFDFTKDNRYTLSEAALDITNKAEAPLIVDVFLQGEFPSEFKRLQTETRSILEEFNAENPNIYFNFINPLEGNADAEAIATQFYQMGMTPARVTVKENGKNEQRIIFPWAMANYNDETVKIPLLKNNLGATTEERVNASVQQLEYVFADAFSKLLTPRKQKIAIMRGNGELPDLNIADFIKTIKPYYRVAPFTLDSVANNPTGTLEKLNEYDLVIEAKPTQAFTEQEKYVLDQYLMQGGKMLWLTEQVAFETDSLFNPTQTSFALPRPLNLDDYFFKYGIRINTELVNDLYSAPLILASGQGEDTQFNPYPWFYFPLPTATKAHPIVNNIEAVKFEYANPIDTLKNSINKTVLLTSSPTTKLDAVPRQLSLKALGQQPNLELYKDGEQPLAVLLEGSFTSVYENRLKPFSYKNNINNSEATAMLVISDGDIIKNKTNGNQPLELGFERYTGAAYGNKEFLLNSVNYLLDDTGLIDIRSKEISIAFLNPDKIADEKLKWQLINILLPLVLLAIFGVVFISLRKRKYTL
ncbi:MULTISPECIES: gliding motility-associated ABC transporter substrate-binding protein GldG [Croceibacter]|mgnify:FL=1|uniref:gliding motility-associated ABC transporter substrate-binding protein GldG n=1 Tax=Croceibacter TaxID=216431 RepID=UPI000C3E2E8C|nr:MULTISPECIES: gliding motility-associated ABC transporter substrate-binding protein GldG [Croceibacter]MBG26402.1 gliding motility-associated ABC transporter substrate-binding protein GldG [Croceibacter sp.]